MSEKPAISDKENNDDSLIDKEKSPYAYLRKRFSDDRDISRFDQSTKVQIIKIQSCRLLLSLLFT